MEYNEITDEQYGFADKLIQVIPAINGWIPDVCSMTGCVNFTNKDFKRMWVYATPNFEGMPSVPVAVEDNGKDFEPVIHSDSIPFVPTGDLEKDVEAYVSLMKPVFQTIEELSNALAK